MYFSVLNNIDQRLSWKISTILNITRKLYWYKLIYSVSKCMDILFNLLFFPSVVFSGVVHQWNWPPQYNWNIIKRGVKHHHSPTLLSFFFTSPWYRWNIADSDVKHQKFKNKSFLFTTIWRLFYLVGLQTNQLLWPRTATLIHRPF